jgi:hypothetical protein
LATPPRDSRGHTVGDLKLSLVYGWRRAGIPLSGLVGIGSSPAQAALKFQLDRLAGQLGLVPNPELWRIRLIEVSTVARRTPSASLSA